VVQQTALANDVHGDGLGVNLKHLSDNIDEGGLLAIHLGATVVKLDLQAVVNHSQRQGTHAGKEAA
jgi:hypothetical protein